MEEYYRRYDEGERLDAISRFAYLMYGFARNAIEDPSFVEMVERHFTDAYFHLPGELRDEVAGAGFTAPRLLAIEGPYWSMAELPGWKAPQTRRVMLRLLEQVEAEPSLLGASAHIMAIATRPKSRR